MKTNITICFLVIVANCGSVSAEIRVRTPLELVKAEDPTERSKGFYDLIAHDSVSGRDIFNCGFTEVDTNAAKKAVIGLLRQERTFDFTAFYAEKYGVKVSRKEMYTRREEKPIKNYLYAREGYGEYLGDLTTFVDSCEDESAVDLFPGEKTFLKYPKKSANLVLSKLIGVEKAGADIKEKFIFPLLLLGKTTRQYRESDKELYKKVKTRVIDLTDDEFLGNVAVSVMGDIGDSDFIPVLEKISKYDNTRGKPVVSSVTGQKRIRPISTEAKQALKRFEEDSKQNTEPDLQKSTTTQ